MEHVDVAIAGDMQSHNLHYHSSTLSAICIDPAVLASSCALVNCGNMSNLQASNLFSVQGRVVVITGGGSGLTCPTMEKNQEYPPFLTKLY